MNPYTLIMSILDYGMYDVENIMNKANVFFGLDQLTVDEYKEIMERLDIETHEEESEHEAVVLPELEDELVEEENEAVVLPE